MPKRITEWIWDDGSFRAGLFWHNGGPFDGEINTHRSRGVWICRNMERGSAQASQWLARSWQGAYDRMRELGYQPCEA